MDGGWIARSIRSAAFGVAVGSLFADNGLESALAAGAISGVGSALIQSGAYGLGGYALEETVGGIFGAANTYIWNQQGYTVPMVAAGISSATAFLSAGLEATNRNDIADILSHVSTAASGVAMAYPLIDAVDWGSLLDTPNIESQEGVMKHTHEVDHVHKAGEVYGIQHPVEYQAPEQYTDNVRLAFDTSGIMYWDMQELSDKLVVSADAALNNFVNSAGNPVVYIEYTDGSTDIFAFSQQVSIPNLDDMHYVGVGRLYDNNILELGASQLMQWGIDSVPGN